MKRQFFIDVSGIYSTVTRISCQGCKFAVKNVQFSPYDVFLAHKLSGVSEVKKSGNLITHFSTLNALG